jgi:hypothetical protein
MRCSNCLHEGPDVVRALVKREYYVCPKCSVTYGKSRDGTTFLLNEEVYVKPGFSAQLNGRIVIITGIFIFEECESGRMMTLKDKETGKPFKTELDINWLLKIKK